MNELNNKKGSVSAVIIVVLLTVIIGLGFYIACDKGLIFNNDNNNEEINNNENSNNDNNVTEDNDDKVPAGETKITDSTIIDILKENISIISEGSNGCFLPIIENLYKNDIYNSSVSTEDKLLLALNSVSKVVEGPDSSKKISAKTVEQQLYKLFGETKNIKHKGFDYCPFYTYDENQKIYTYSFACGGGCDVDGITYIYDYSYEDNKYYVYQSLGRFEHKYNEETEETTSVLYKNVEKTDIYKTNIDISFEINESNYQDFSAYKWTFIKDSEGNYIFDSLVRIK